MPAATLPRTGSAFVDARGEGRALRASWHTERGLVVLSLWRDNVCAGSFRLAAADVPDLIAALSAGLATVCRDRADDAPTAHAG